MVSSVQPPVTRTETNTGELRCVNEMCNLHRRYHSTLLLLPPGLLPSSKLDLQHPGVVCNSFMLYLSSREAGSCSLVFSF